MQSMAVCLRVNGFSGQPVLQISNCVECLGHISRFCWLLFTVSCKHCKVLQRMVLKQRMHLISGKHHALCKTAVFHDAVVAYWQVQCVSCCGACRRWVSSSKPLHAHDPPTTVNVQAVSEVLSSIVRQIQKS